MKKHDTLWIGFMLFALFFGAGNLIYPPLLGLQAGEHFWWAIGGFLLTGVSLPVLCIYAISRAKGGAEELSHMVHPLFGLFFMVIVYLSIGPFFGIPRAANVAFEMSVGTLPNGNLLLFTSIFFALVYYISLNPSKLVDRIGQWVTPVLLLAIVILCIIAFIRLDEPMSKPSEAYQNHPFIKGFLEGYLTMDTIGALAFGIIVVSALKDRGVLATSSIRKYALRSGIVAGIGLAFVYSSIGWLGAKMSGLGEYSNGSDILSAGAQLLFGTGGSWLLGVIVILACYTTAVGLTVATAQYFKKIFPQFSYSTLVAVLTIVSFLVANLGLSQIISYSVPVLIFVYPLAIVLILLSFANQLLDKTPTVYRGAVLFTGLIGIIDAWKAIGFAALPFEPIIAMIPFYSVGLGWIIPAAVGGLFGFIFDKIYGTAKLEKETYS